MQSYHTVFFSVIIIIIIIIIKPCTFPLLPPFSRHPLNIFLSTFGYCPSSPWKRQQSLRRTWIMVSVMIRSFHSDRGKMTAGSLILKGETKYKKWELLRYLSDEYVPRCSWFICKTKTRRHFTAFCPFSCKDTGQWNSLGKGFYRGHKFNQGFRMHEGISLGYIENTLKRSTLFARNSS